MQYTTQHTLRPAAHTNAPFHWTKPLREPQPHRTKPRGPLRARASTITLALLCLGLALLLTLYSPLASQGARDGLVLCGQVIIPSLFPFLVLGNLFAQLISKRPASQNQPAAQGRGTLRARTMHFLLRQPPVALGVIFLGFLGGYPAGAKTAAQLMERGALTKVQAQRLQLFCVNAGPAYLLGAIGSALLGSKQAGLLLFASLTAAGCVMAFVSRFWDAPGTEDDSPLLTANPQIMSSSPLRTVNDAGVLSAVAQATAATMGICAWVVLFSALCALLRLLPHAVWPAIPSLNVFLEVSSGAAAIIRKGTTLPVLCAALGWGGLSVHCQILADLRKTGLPLRVFFTSRLMHGALAAAICWQLSSRFPVEQTTAAIASAAATAAAGSFQHARLWAVSAPAAAALLFFCAFFIMELDLNRKIC